MPDYQQTPVTGVEYPRAYAIEIANRYGLTPSITFHMEALTLLASGQTLSRGLPPVSAAFDPEAEIPLLNPADGEPTGETVTQEYLYQILFSLCEQLRQPQTTPEEEPTA